MSLPGFQSLLYLLLLIPPLLFLQRNLQREIQSVFLLLTRQPEISMALFSLIFLPGVLLHESSHFIMAHILGVPTGRFSLIPRKVANGRLQLGYVETASTDFFRDSLIGGAPLLAGGLLVAIIGVSQLELGVLWGAFMQGQAGAVRSAFKSILDLPDFWLWFYLVFAISSTMLPSPSDRRAWLPLITIFIIIIAVVLLFGAGAWVLSRFGSTIKTALDAVAVVVGITLMIHLLVLPPVWLARKIISRLTGYQVV
jgi:hypothetical protein